MAAADIVVKCEEFIDSEDHVEEGNSTYFNVYEHPQDSEPENDENRREGSEYENDDIKMQELLREFDLEILFTLLKFGDITYRSLKYISENDINAAIRSIAYRAEFREKLFAWRRDKYGLNDFSVLPPPKQTPMPLGVNNSNNILSTNTNTNRVPNSPMHTSTNTKQAPGSAAPRARRLSAPKTSAAKKARVSNQSAPIKRSSNASPPPPPSPTPPSPTRTRTPTASRSLNSPTPTLSEALSILQQDTTSHPSMDFDDPLCFQPTTSSAAATATTSASSAIPATTDSLLFEPPPKMAIGKLAPTNNVTERYHKHTANRLYYNWEIKYLCRLNGGDLQCLICKTHISCRDYTIRSHYQRFHNEYDKYDGHSKIKIWEELTCDMDPIIKDSTSCDRAKDVKIKHGRFDSEWEIRYLCRYDSGESQCLICKKHISCKQFNVRRHYINFHNEFEKYDGLSRNEIWEALKCGLDL